MQKPIEGEVSHPKNVGGGVAIGEKTAQKHVENQPNPNYLKYIKGGYRRKSHNRTANPDPQIQKPHPPHPKTPTNIPKHLSATDKITIHRFKKTRSETDWQLKDFSKPNAHQ